jgi:TIR domain-containing protein
MCSTLGGMMAVRVFVSYSRSDFPVAEAVVAELRRAGLDPWLDVQRLRPGVDWSRAIDESLDDADALLLLASPAAMDSAAVCHEWQWARRRHIPVHVAVVRTVELPPGLAGCPGVDLRVRPWRNIAALGQALAGAGGAAARPDRWRRPGRLPVVVACAVGLAAANAALLLSTTLFMLVRILAAGANGGVYTTVFGSVNASAAAVAVVGIPLLGVAVAVLLTVSHLGLLRRRSTLRTLGISLAASIGYCGLLTVTAMPSPVPGLVLVIGVLSLAGGGLLWRSRTVRLWLPVGHRADPERWVFTALASWPAGTDTFPWPDFRWRWRALRTRFPTAPTNRDSVEVWSAAADEPVAALFRSACRDAGFVVDHAPATWVFVLVSTHSDRAALYEQIERVPARAICVLVDSMALPADSVEFRRYQWMDFRGQDADHLFWLLSALRVPDRASDDHTVLAPVDPARYRAPLGVVAFSETCRDVLAFLVGVTTGTLLARPFDGRAGALVGVTALLVWSLAVLHVRMTRRGITLWPAAGIAAVTGLLSWVWVAIWWWYCGSTLAAAFPETAGPLAMGLTPLLLPFFLAVASWYLARDWLPRGGVRRDRAAVGDSLWASFMPLTFAAAVATTLPALLVR